MSTVIQYFPLRLFIKYLYKCKQNCELFYHAHGHFHSQRMMSLFQSGLYSICFRSKTGYFAKLMCQECITSAKWNRYDHRDWWQKSHLEIRSKRSIQCKPRNLQQLCKKNFILLSLHCLMFKPRTLHATLWYF